MSAETWKGIPGFEGRYEASNLGRIRSCDRVVFAVRLGKPWSSKRLGQVLRVRPDSAGYQRVQLGKHGPTSLVHRLVLEAFSGPCPKGHEAAHRDGMRDNNRVENLRWTTHADNLADRLEHGTAVCGERSPNARITADQAASIRAARGRKTQHMLAAEFGISQARISKIQRGEAWS